jgi:NADP-dependent 3-hydroxy acid dehydrogenase YdfG
MFLQIDTAIKQMGGLDVLVLNAGEVLVQVMLHTELQHLDTFMHTDAGHPWCPRW